MNGDPVDSGKTDSHSAAKHHHWAALVIAAITVGLVWAAAQYKYYVLPKRFRVVEAGQIYRGGWQTPRVLERIVQKYHIKSVLNVACNPTEPEAAGEGTVVREHAVRWLKILMPGTGLATIAQLDEAADFLADTDNRPIFIHCAAGIHRTNMSLAAYRLKHCGWTLDATLDEMANNGYDRANDMDKAILLSEYVEHLRDSPTTDEVMEPLLTTGTFHTQAMTSGDRD